MESNFDFIIEKSFQKFKSNLLLLGFENEEINHFQDFFIRSSDLFKVFISYFYNKGLFSEYEIILENAFYLNFYARLFDNILDENVEYDKILFLKASSIPLKVFRNYALIFDQRNDFWLYFEKYINITFNTHIKEKKHDLYEDYDDLGKKSNYIMVYIASLCFINNMKNLIPLYENIVIKFFSARQIINDFSEDTLNHSLKIKYLENIKECINYSDILNDLTLKNYFNSFLII